MPKDKRKLIDPASPLFFGGQRPLSPTPTKCIFTAWTSTNERARELRRLRVLGYISPIHLKSGLVTSEVSYAIC